MVLLPMSVYNYSDAPLDVQGRVPECKWIFLIPAGNTQDLTNALRFMRQVDPTLEDHYCGTLTITPPCIASSICDIM